MGELDNVATCYAWFYATGRRMYLQENALPEIKEELSSYTRSNFTNITLGTSAISYLLWATTQRVAELTGKQLLMAQTTMSYYQYQFAQTSHPTHLVHCCCI